MADAALGTRDAHSDWRPPYVLEPPAPLAWPPRPLGVLKWVFGFPGLLWPWNTMYLAIAAATWFFLTPPLATMQNFEVGWIAIVLGRNFGLTLVIFGAWHFYL